MELDQKVKDAVQTISDWVDENKMSGVSFLSWTQLSPGLSLAVGTDVI